MAGHYRGADDYATIDRSSAETYARMRKHRHGRGKHIILGILGVILGVVLVEAIGLAWTGYHMYGDLKAVKSETSILEESIKNGDAEATQTALDEVQSGVHGINDGLHSVPWQVAAHFPGVGSDIRIAQQLGETGTGLVDDALVPFVGAIKGTSLATLFADGKIDAEGVQRISDAYATVAPVVRTGIDDLNAIPEGENTKLKQVEDKVKAPLQKATEMLDFADAVLPYAPQMVGAGGQTRTYLLVAQNNSELRATGGFPGSWIPVTVTDGQISIGDSQTLQGERDYGFPITDEERAVFGEGMSQSPGNLNCTPDFTRAGMLFAMAWKAYTGQDVNGVIAMDPMFIQDLLVFTGGITAPDGEVVDGTNAAQVLLSGTYWKFGSDPEAQDAYFSAVAGLCTQQIMGNLGAADLSELVKMIQTDANERRVYAYMVDEGEEAAMQRIGLGGELSTDTTKPVLGVYVNDNTWAKMCWYERIQTTIGEAVTNEDGTKTYPVTTTLTNMATAEELASAPEYVTGNSPLKRDAYDIFNSPVILMAPAGGNITDVQIGGQANAAASQLYGHAIIIGDANMEPQETVTFAYNVTVPAEATEDLTVDQTPTGQRF